MAEHESGVRGMVRRILAGGGSRVPPDPGAPFAGTGLEALARLERRAGSRLVAGSGLAHRPELEGAVTGGLATALGLALGGERTALFVAGAELESQIAELVEAVARRAPLVVHAVGGLEAARAAAEAGAAVWVPASVAEAVDLAIALRRCVEETLGLAVLVLDRPGLADAVQEAWLPETSALARRLGHPADEIHASGPAQEVLFGRHRRRVPRWHDAGRAVRLGGEPGAWGAAPRAAAAARLFDAALPDHLEAALAETSASTGRDLPALVGRRLSRPDLGVVAAGPLAETAAAIAEQVRDSGLRVAVFGVHRWAPFPGAELAELAASCPRLAVFERGGERAGEGPLASAVARALAATPRGVDIASLRIAGEDAPLGGGELAAAWRSLAGSGRPALVLGLAGGATDEEGPRRRALHDALAREVAGIDALACPAQEAPVDPRPPGARTLQLVGAPANGRLGADLARLIHALAGGHLRSRSLPPGAAGRSRSERIVWSLEPLAEPGDGLAAEVVALLGDGVADAPRIASGGTLLVADGAAESAGLRARATAREIEIVDLAGAPEEADELRHERWLGALVAAFARRAASETKVRRLRAERETQLLAVAVEDRERRLEALVAGFETPPRSAAPSEPAPADPSVATPAVPLALARALAAPHEGGGLGDPARFFDLAGRPVAEGRGGRILPDPTLALLAAPACSTPLGAHPGELPELDPARCTGCGACWTQCPHSAIETRVLAPAALLEHVFVAAGRTAEPLRRFGSKILTRLTERAGVVRGGSAAELFDHAVAAALADARVEEDRRAPLEAARAAVRAQLEPLALAAPPVFHGDAERARRGSGELVLLAIDPDRCTGCGLCVAACEPEALTLLTAAPGRIEAARRSAASVAGLPPTAPATLDRARADARVGAVAGALLADAAQLPLAGFDGAEPGSGPRLAARQALGLLAFHLDARRRASVARVEEICQRLTTAVHETLAAAVPDRDLGALARGLDEVERPTADIADVVTRLTGAVESERVDVPRLRRLVEVARAAADLRQKLGTDGGETGRAPLSVVVGRGPALDWARRFPDNPFGVPATAAAGPALALARGLALAETRRATAEARVLRRAAIELDQPGEAVASAEALAALGWEDLAEEERALATPVVALIDETAERAAAEELLALAGGELPVAVVALAAPPRPDEARSPYSAIAFAVDAGVVAHATIAHVEPLEQAAAAFAARSGGALVRVLAPSPGREGIVPTEIQGRARGVVEAREFPLGCRVATVHPAAAAPRVDPSAEAAENERRHAAELAAAEARHAAELAAVEGETRRRLAAAARERLLELAARRRAEPPEAREVP
jgi:pyruvate-ferredoxin/flavodoxin oxidoreductase